MTTALLEKRPCISGDCKFTASFDDKLRDKMIARCAITTEYANRMLLSGSDMEPGDCPYAAMNADLQMMEGKL